MDRTYSARKQEYFERLTGLFSNYNKCLMVTADNVGSFQMQQVRMALRGEAVVCFGKNTMMRRVLKNFLEQNKGHDYSKIMSSLQGNTGLVFTNCPDLGKIKQIIVENVVPAPARAGAIAPCAVIVPPGPTGMDPGSTSFFQALQVQTKINRGQIEIIDPVDLIAVGDIVTAGAAALLQKLGIAPFSYGLVVQKVYDNGAFFDAKILDLDDDSMKAKFSFAVSKLASVSLAIGYPTTASLPHTVSGAFQKIACIALELGLEDAFAGIKKALAEAGSGGGGSGGKAGGAEAAEEAKEEEPEEEEELDLGGGGGMFDDDDGGADY
jgi:large subunit ribosomal protein LP0